MRKTKLLSFLPILLLVNLLLSCSTEENNYPFDPGWATVQDSADIVFSIDGFAGPEAVRYDPEQDVFFVSNFNGGGNDRDANGFISKVKADGSENEVAFITGTDAYPLHAPRGMFITGDTLWAADIDGVHGFNRQSGEQVAFIDFSSFEPGFLNDIAAGPAGNLYVTDTGKSVLYRINGRQPSIAVDSLPHPPNGITLSPDSSRLVLAPWNGGTIFYAWSPAEEALNEFGSAGGGGNYDGIEFAGQRLISASQADSSLHLMHEGSDSLYIHVPGRPADIGLDTKRNHVAVPYIALDRVDVWKLPGN